MRKLNALKYEIGKKRLPSNYILKRRFLMFKRFEEIFNLSSEMRNLLHYEIAKRFF